MHLREHFFDGLFVRLCKEGPIQQFEILVIGRLSQIDDLFRSGEQRHQR